jgi:hypothetical protein
MCVLSTSPASIGREITGGGDVCQHRARYFSAMGIGLIRRRDFGPGSLRTLEIGIRMSPGARAADVLGTTDALRSGTAHALRKVRLQPRARKTPTPVVTREPEIAGSPSGIRL